MGLPRFPRLLAVCGLSIAALVAHSQTGCSPAPSVAPKIEVDEAYRRAEFEKLPIERAARDYFLPKQYADYFPGMDKYSPRSASFTAPADQLLDIAPAPPPAQAQNPPQDAPPTYQPRDLPLDKHVVLGRNTWMIWCAGNEGFWDWLSTDSQGFIDLLKLVDSRNRSQRFAEAGLINEPGMTTARSPMPDEFGLWLDQPTEARVREWRGVYLRETFAEIGEGLHKSQRGQPWYRGAPWSGQDEPGYEPAGAYMRREMDRRRRAQRDAPTYGESGRYGGPMEILAGSRAVATYKPDWIVSPVRGRQDEDYSYGRRAGGAQDDAAPYEEAYADIPPPDIYGISSGVVGLRLFPNPRFDAEARKKWDADRYYKDKDYYLDPKLVRPYRVGMSCAFCHASFHPLQPPRDVANPEWANISGSIGAQYLRIRSVFGNLLEKDNFVYHLLDSQPPGTVDTSLIASDNINNSNTMNAVFNLPQRALLSFRNPRERQSPPNLLVPSLWTSPQSAPGENAPDPVPQTWDQVFRSQGLREQLTHSNEDPRYTPRVLLDGADSIGAYGALARVYLNIGSYYERWNQLHQPVIGFQPQQPFRIRDCENNSVYWNATRLRVDALRDYFLVASYGMPLLATEGAESRLEKIDEPTVRAAAKAGQKDPDAAWRDARARHIDVSKLAKGRAVFAKNCIVCHSSIQPESSAATFFAYLDDSQDAVQKTAKAERDAQRSAYEKRYSELIARRTAQRAQYERDGQLWEHEPGRWLVDPAYAEWAQDAVNRNEFWKWNYLSTDFRIAVTDVGTNSGRAMATNGLTGHMWEDFSSESYRHLPTVGEISFWNPYKGETGDWDAYTPQHETAPGVPEKGGGVGFYRVPTLVSIWATAPLLHNNSLGVFNNDPSVDGRLDAFDDAIRKLLWKEKRFESSSYNGATPERLKRDQGLIWRIPNESYLTIRGKFVPHALEQFPIYRWLRDRFPWLESVAPLWLPSGLLLGAAFALLAAAGEPSRRWVGGVSLFLGVLWAIWLFVWPWLPAVLLLIATVLLLLVAKYDPRLFRAALLALAMTLVAALATWAVQTYPDARLVVALDSIQPRALPLIVFLICGAALVLPLSVKWSRYVGYGLIVSSLAIGSLVYFAAGRLGDVRVGPIPAGTPVNLLANTNPETPRGEFKQATVAAIGAMAQIKSQNLSASEAQKVMQQKVAPELMKINKCPDFVMDRGHYFPWFDDMSDDDKDALIELLKTF
ncbi:MAG: hypothetical protein U0939_23865 [Pirellulales bacterium]